MKKTIIRTLSTTALFSTLFAGSALADSYKVQSGDSLSEIAMTYKTSVNEIKSQNNLTSDRIYVNQILQIATAPATTTVQSVQQTTYKVVSGDALIKIANRYHVTVGELQQWNNINGTLIYVGQVLKVSAPGQTVTVTAPQPAKPAPIPVSTPAAPSSTGEYTIQRGDSLSKIGLQFGMTVQQLKTLNNLKSDMIYVGQKLKINGQAGSTLTPTPISTTPTTTTNSGANIVNVAKSLMGIPYVWGGSSLSGFDCSGFIYYVFNQAGKKIIRTSAAGYYDRSYYVDSPVAGDLVFFENTYKPGISHVGIYLGDNQFIQADGTHGIMISNLKSNYYTSHFAAFKRFY